MSYTNKQAAPRRQTRGPRDSYRPSGIPQEIQESAGPRPILRVKNIHSDLDGGDLLELFSGIAAVDFIKFDPKKDSVAYVCFQERNSENNRAAIAKFDGRKAMGKILIVENASSLADRIAVPRNDRERADRNERADRDGRRGRGQAQARTRKPRPQKKTVDDLDEELSAYMAGNGGDKPLEPAEARTEASEPADSMNLD